MPPRKKARRQQNQQEGPKTRSGSPRTAEVTLPGATAGPEPEYIQLASDGQGQAGTEPGGMSQSGSSVLSTWTNALGFPGVSNEIIRRNTNYPAFGDN